MGCNHSVSHEQQNDVQLTMLKSDLSFSTYAKFPKKLIFLTPWYGHAGLPLIGSVYHRVRNVSFSENFAYVLNK